MTWIGETADFGWFMRFLAAHVLPESRDDFIETALSAEGIDAEWLSVTIELFTNELYGGLPLGALLALWRLWPESEHVAHGRLLLAGHPSGSASLDTYDIACLMWAQIEVEKGIHNPMADPAEARQAAEQLRSDLMQMQTSPGTHRSEVDEFAALLTRSAQGGLGNP